MQDYRKLKIWIEGMVYVEDIYRFAQTILRDERYGLTDQLKRAAVSVPLNIAEGAGCNSDPEFQKFLWYAYRSLNEVITCLELARRLKLSTVNNDQTHNLIDQGDKLSAMVFKFIHTLDR